MKICDRIFGEFRSQVGRKSILGVVLLGAFLRLWVAWQPIEILIGKNLPDDAYYYFVIARNTLQLGSVSMDGVSITNGFHPLWMVILMPLFGWISGSSNLPISLTLTLATMMDLVTILIVGRLAACFTRRETLGVLAAWIYAANPVVILQVTNGLETAVGMLTLAIFVWLTKQWLTQLPNMRLAIMTGLSGAIMFLARSDSIFLLGLAFLVAIWYWRERPGIWRNILVGWGTFLLFVSPWFIWSRLTVGSWLQESGVAVPYAVRVRVAMEQGTGWLVIMKEAIRQITYPVIWLRGDFSGLPLFIGFILWLIVIIWFALSWRKSATRAETAFLIPLLGSGLALIIAHAGVRWYPRPWYFIPSSMAFALSFVMAGRTFLEHPRRIFLTFLAIATYFTVAGYIFWQIGYFPWQRETLAANDWLNENIPSDSMVASFNSGIYSYYNEFPVLNLDGVVNHQGFEAVRDRQVLPYLQHSKVDYLIDYDLAIWEEYAPFMGEGFPEALEEIVVLSSRPDENLGQLRLYRVSR